MQGRTCYHHGMFRQISQKKDIVSDSLNLLQYYCSVMNTPKKKSDYLGNVDSHGMGNKPIGAMWIWGP